MADASSVRSAHGDGTPLLRRRHPTGPGKGSSSSSSLKGRMHQPGSPIGYLAAVGTPYQKKYLSKKLSFACLFIVPPVAVVAIIIVLVPVIWAIADHTLKVVQLQIHEANLTSLTNTSFPLSLSGSALKAGIFPALLRFRAPLDVYWMTPPPNMREVRLGIFQLDRVNVASGHGKVIQSTVFNITDQDAFGLFTKYLVTQPQFTWNLVCPNTHVEALGFLPTYKNYVFRKHVNFKAINNFEDVKLLDFQLPGNDPAGGITFQALTSLRNPSPFSVQVGYLNVDLYYKDLFLGPGASAGPINIRSGPNTIMLVGRLLPQNHNQTALDMLGTLFTQYINGEAVPVIAQGRSTTQTNGDKISWLTQGIEALAIHVPLQSQTPINPIKAIQINEFSIVFSDQQQWTPTAFSDQLQAQLGLPFGFQLNIIETQNDIDLMFNGSVVGQVQGAFSNSTLNLDVINAGNTGGVLGLTLPPSPIVIGNSSEERQRWVDFQNVLVFSVNTSTRLRGQSHVVTDTPVGRIFLSPINFDVESGLTGLQGLNKYPTTISGVDLTGGTQEALLLDIQTTIINPSNLNMTTGTVHFELLNKEAIGNVSMSDLHLDLGENNVTANAIFDPKAGPEGQQTLNRFVSGINTKLYINGFNGSTDIAPLLPSLSSLRLNSTLPGLQHSLVGNAQLEILTTTGITNDSATSYVSIDNPFTAGLAITRIESQVYAYGIALAHIDQRLDFDAKGNSTSVSPPIPLEVNLNPPDIFGAVRAYAIHAGLDPTYVEAIVQVGGYNITPTSDTPPDARPSPSDQGPGSTKRSMFEDIEPVQTPLADMQFAIRHTLDRRMVHHLHKRNMFKGFNLTDYVKNAFASATVNLSIDAQSMVGQYNTSLSFAQQNVPLKTDNTLFYLLPVLAQPIVQRIVNRAILAIDTVTVLDPKQDTFGVHLEGQLTDAGPFDGLVHFPQGMSVFYLDRLLGKIPFPDITLVGDVGATINVTTSFQVANVSFMEQFTKDALNGPSFNWTIASDGIVVDALDISVPNISLSKDVALAGFDGLKNEVQISSFDIPSDDPAGGIHLNVATTLNNPSQLGMELSEFGVDVMGNNTFLGPASAANPFTLAARAQTQLNLTGRLVHQDDQQGTDVLSNVFTNFVHNQPTGLVVNGDHAGPPNVSWLNNAIRTLSIPVTLPSAEFNVIRGVTLNQLSLAFTEQSAWDPATSSGNTTAPFYLPFAFPINITQVQGQFIANYQSQDAAVLNIPPSASTTDVENRVLSLAFHGVPFDVYDDKHQVFSQFLADATLHNQVRFGLHGTATTEAETAAGVVTISDVPFSVNTSILGLQGFNARPANVSDLDVARGYRDYLQINLNTHLFNPSDITISTGDVQFQVLYDNHPIGPAIISDLTAVPAENMFPTALHYSPQGDTNTQAGLTVLNNYVGNITTDAVVAGNDQSTHVASLSQALEGVRLETQIPPLGKLLITEGWLTVPKEIDHNPTTWVKVNVANPFTATLNIETIQASPGYNNLTLGQINTDLKPPITAPGKKDTASQPIPMILDTNPKALVELLLQVAAASGTSLGPWPPFLQQILDMPGNASTQVQSYPGGDESSCPSNGAFDLEAAMLQALKSLAVRIPIVTDTNIDLYGVQLNFVQNPVPIHTDETALYLLGPAGAPLIQRIVDQAGLSFNQGNITEVSDSGFTVHLRGTLQTDAPTNALIEFLSPLEIRWQGQFIGTISLPPICTIPGQGVPDLATTGQVQIVDQDGFTQFATFILHNEEFTWDISSPNVSVLALGTTFTQVNLAKSVKFKSFNGLSGVTTSNFDIPGEGSDSLNVKVGASIPSPATLGIELNTAKFSLFFQGVQLGNVQANDLTLTPSAITSTTLVGSLVKQTSQQGLDSLGVLFTQFLQGKNLSVVVQGLEVDTPYQNGRVGWLSDAFQTLKLDVTLQGHVYEVIFAISLLDLELYLVDNPAQVAYSIPASSQQTVAQYANPFHFTLSPKQASVKATILYQGVNTAQLSLPMLPVGGEASTGPETHSPLTLSFKDQTLQSLNNNQFQQFLAQATDSSDLNFQLTGSATVQADTHIGFIQIADIGLSVPSHLTGINSFNHQAPLSDVLLVGSTPEYIIVPLNASLINPSNITLTTRDLYLPVFYKGTDVGRAFVDTLTLQPAATTIKRLQFYYSPADPNDPTALELVGNYVNPLNDGAGGTSAPQMTSLTIGGAPTEQKWPESPYNSLIPALQGLNMPTALPGAGIRLVPELDVTVDVLPSLLNSQGTGVMIIHNQLGAGITVETIDANLWKGGVEDGPVRAVVHQSIQPPVRIAPTATERVPVTFTMPPGLLGSLDILAQPLSFRSHIELRIDGGYNIPALPLNLFDVHTTYLLTVLGIPINITSIADFLPTILSVLNPEQITNDLLPTLQKLPLNEVQQMAQSLDTSNPLVQFACNAVPILKGLPVCQPAGGLHLRDLRQIIEKRNYSGTFNTTPSPGMLPP